MSAGGPGWVMDEQLMAELLQLFRQAQEPNPEFHQRMQVTAQSLRQRSDGVKYLALIFSQYKSETIVCRQMVGLFLKSVIASLVPASARTQQIISEPLQESLSCVERLALGALSDESDDIRRTAGTIITSLLTGLGCERCSHMLSVLINYVQSASLPVALSALDTLKKITEDELDPHWQLMSPSPTPTATTTMLNANGARTDASPASSVANHRHLSDDAHFVAFSKEHLLPLLMKLGKSPEVHPSVAILALQILEIYNNRHAFAFRYFAQDYFDAYWQLLGRVAVDERLNAKLLVLRAMSRILEYNSRIITDNAAVIFDLFVKGSADPSYDVRLVALTFWSEIVKETAALPHLERILPQLVPILIENSIYTDHDYAGLDQAQLEDDNASVSDMTNTLAPRFHRSERGGGDDEDDDDDDDDDDDEINGGGAKSTWGNNWTVRKSAAFALDVLCVALRGKMLPHCLGLIEQRLQNESSWEVQESGVLALGAISKGCLSDLDQFVPVVLQLLIRLSSSRKPLLRSICCWCLNRFAAWYCAPERSGEYMEPVLKALLLRMIDQNKCVQEAACSAVAGVEEVAKKALIPQLPNMYECFSRALNLYQTKNLAILYDAIGTLAKMLRDQLVEAYPARYLQTVLDPLLAKWQNLRAGDYELIAFAECMGYVAQALGPEIGPAIPMLVTKTGMIMRDYMIRIRKASSEGAGVDYTSTDALECCLDLLSYLLDASSSHFNQTFEQQNIMEIVKSACIEPEFAAVMTLKQSAFALIGDLAFHCYPVLRLSLPQLIPCLASHLTASMSAVSSNASWALGQIVEVAEPEIMDAYMVEFIIGQLCQIIRSSFEGHLLLKQNVCITLGRFGGHYPTIVGGVLPQVLRDWCEILSQCSSEDEKLRSFAGLAKAIVESVDAARANKRILLKFMDTLLYREDDTLPSAQIVTALSQWLSNLPDDATKSAPATE